MGVYATLGIYDYDRRKICDLYDSQNHLDGQAYDIQFIEEMKDGTQTLSFSIPYMIDSSKNFRWDYLKNEYLIRMTYGNRTEWFVASKPSRKKSQKEIIGVVNCNDLASLLKTRNIYMEFDDENGIGTAEYLMRQILKGTGWKLGDCDTIYESDGVTEKIRSLTSGGKTGARGLIGSVCNLFMCRPVYHSDPMKVDIISLNDRTQVLEGSVGNNLLSVNITKDSSDLITRLYVEGEYGDFGYVGIDDVNPTGLNYLFNFDYFREIGVFKQEHEDAYNTYIGQISNIVRQIRSNQELITGVEDELNTLIGQCQLVVYYRQSGFAEPKYIYGNPPTSKIPLVPRDKIMILQNDGKFRYATIVTSPEALMQDGDYAVAKFITPASGIIGGKEVQIEAKEQTIEQLEEKISLTTKEEKISEFNKEIGQLEAEISVILNGTSYSGQLENLAQYYVPAGYTGNVDLTNRIVIAGHRMNDAGWDSYESFDKGTLFPQTYTLSGTSQRYVASFTPVMTNGTVMTPDRLTAYVRDVEYEASHTGKTIAEADAEDLKLMLYCIDESTYSTIDTALVAMKQKVDKLKELQDSWDTVRARYDWFGYEYMDPDGMYDDAQGEAVDSLYSYVNSVMAEGGKLEILDGYVDIAEGLYARQNDVEATFIAAMGYLLRDGYWSDTNYATGQEEHLYQDALVHSEKMGQPEITCNVEYARINEKYGIPIQDIEMNAIFRVQDQDMNVYENLFVTKVVIGIDQENVGTINISNKDISMNTNDLGSLLSRISQLSDLVEQKNALYERAKAISKSGTFYADRLNGAIDVLTNQLKSTVSNWYTDEQGNIIFEAADGGSAMMLCGAGFMIAGSKKEDTGDWNWRTFGTGAGFVADEIIAGFLSVDRIESGSIVTSKLSSEVGQELVIEHNPAVEGLTTRITLAEGRIESIVSSMGKTYVQYDDPAVQYGSDAIHVGDIWVKTSLVETWDEFKKRTWATIARSKWADVFPKTYAWDGKEWVEIANAQEQAYQATRIEQTDRKIEMTATRVNFVEGKLESKITQTADAITMEVSRATAAEGTLGTRITQTADAITLCATVDGTRAAGLSKSVKTVGSYITIENKGITLASGGFIKCKADQIQIGTDASDTIKQALEDLDDLVDTAQSTADGAATAASSAATAAATADGKAVAAKAAADAADAAAAAASSAAAKIVSGADGVKAKYCQLIENTGITINDTTLALTASGNMHIAAGGSLTIASANEGYPSVISMDSTGLSFASGGSISIYNTSGNNSVYIGSTGIHIASGGRFTVASNAGIYLQSGAEFIVDAPNFKVRESGDVIIAGNLYHHGNEVLTKQSLGVGSTEPTGASSGDVWIKPRVGATALFYTTVTDYSAVYRNPISVRTIGGARVEAGSAAYYKYLLTVQLINESGYPHGVGHIYYWCVITGDDGNGNSLTVNVPEHELPVVDGPITFVFTATSSYWLGNGVNGNATIQFGRRVTDESGNPLSTSDRFVYVYNSLITLEMQSITSWGGWTQADVYVKD